jgi:hypothetical protein
VTTKGSFSGTRGSGTISAGSAGETITYDYAGERATMTDASSSEAYTYTADGFLAQTSIGGTVRAKYVLDAMGRTTSYSEYNSAGTSVVYSRAATYNNASEVTYDQVTAVRTDGTWVTSTNYDYDLETYTGSGVWTGAYQGGVVTHSRSTVTKNGTSQPTNDTKNTFLWLDTALTSTAVYTPDISAPSTTNNTQYRYDGMGRLVFASIADGRPRRVDFVADPNGLILKRDETDNNLSTGDPHELHYYFNGIQVGDVTNNGTSDTDYAVSIAEHDVVPGTGAFRDGGASSTAFADFDQSYNPVNGYDSTNAARSSAGIVIDGALPARADVVRAN